MAEVRGIDVAQHQGRVDWRAVAASGVRFAYIRAFEGKDLDPTYERNRREALAAGLLVGTYQYLRARHPGRYQADLLLDALGELQPGELPPALDCEDLDGRPAVEVQAAILAWMYRVREAIRRPPVIYAGPGWWLGELRGQALSEVASCPLWLADYRQRPQVMRPWTERVIWQHSGSGRCPGIIGAVDLDVAEEAVLGALAVPPPIERTPAPSAEQAAREAHASAVLTLDRSIDDEIERARRGRDE